MNVKVFDNYNNLINQFSDMTSSAKHLGVDRTTIAKLLRTGISYNNYIYKFEAKDLKVWVYDSNHNLINIMDNITKTSLLYKISSTTMCCYIKSSKLYKNKFYFHTL